MLIVSKNQNKETSTVAPFLYKLGIDKDLFLNLNNKKVVFVEGYVDMFVPNKVNEIIWKDQNLFFILIGGATKHHSLINIVTAVSQIRPFFIFDNDKKGKKVLINKKRRLYI